MALSNFLLPKDGEYIMRIGSSAHLAALCAAAIFALGAPAAGAAASELGTRTAGGVPPAISDMRPANEAEIFIQSNIGNAYAILNNHALNADERRLQFHDFLLSITDVRRIAVFTLGPYTRDASDGDIDNFVKAYADFVTAVYQSYFDRYKGQTLQVTSSTERSEGDVIVNADVVGSDGVHQSKIGFRARRSEGRNNVITDFQVAGAWLALAQRSDFTSYLQQHGGKLAPLSSELESRALRIKEKETMPGDGSLAGTP